MGPDGAWGRDVAGSGGNVHVYKSPKYFSAGYGIYLVRRLAYFDEMKSRKIPSHHLIAKNDKRNTRVMCAAYPKLIIKTLEQLH